MTFTLGFAAGVAVTLAWVLTLRLIRGDDDDLDTYADYCNDQDNQPQPNGD